METLNDIYNNEKNSDNDVLIRTLNTFIDCDEPDMIYAYTVKFTNLFEKLLTTSKIQRNEIKFVVETIKKMENDKSFQNFVNTLKQIYEQDMTKNYKYLFIICYCRSVFELTHDRYIKYKKPDYATMEAFGDSSWSVFLKSIKNTDFVYLQ
jgi:hypothetical protein